MKRLNHSSPALAVIFALILLPTMAWAEDSKFIQLKNGAFDPLVAAPAQSRINRGLASRGSAIDDASESIFIVQFNATPSPAQQSELQALGAKIHAAMEDDALLVRMDASTSARVAKWSGVRWVGPFLADYRLEESLYQLLTQDAQSRQTAKPERYVILLFENDQTAKDAVVEAITSRRGEVHISGGGRIIEASFDVNTLNYLAGMNEVLYLERWTEPENDMDMVRQANGANFVETVAGYSGQGVRGEVLDDGLHSTHNDFQVNPPIIHGSNNSDDNHGTLTYGIIFGYGTGNSLARGLLPDAEQPIFSSRLSGFSNRYDHTAELVDPNGPYRAVFQSNSWGSGRNTSYSSVSAAMDDIIFDHDLLITQSQSNAGNRQSRPQAWAKNIVSVGGIRGYDTLSRIDDRWAGGASIGPASDGRIKPDLSQFYGDIFTTAETSNSAYRNFGGTSGATPAVTGHFGIVFQMWADGIFAGGPGLNRDVFDSRPHSTTARALVINSAFQYDFTGTSSDLTRVHQGWGFPDVRNLYEVAEINNWQLPILIDESEILSPNETHSYTLTTTGSDPLKATMVYLDLPGIPNSSVNRVNDITLKATSPGGQVYWGNNGLISGNWSTPGGSANTVDTVENIFIESPEAGNWTIEVIGTEIVQDSHIETAGIIDADYALVVTGGASGAAENQAPRVDAGADQISQVGVALSLTGSVIDDGLPASPGVVSISWAQVSGPGTSTFSDVNSANTIVEFPQQGTYVLSLSADDGERQASDTVSVRVQPPLGSLILSEILYDAVGPDNGLEWVELFNTTSEPIDLSTYSLGNGGNDYTYSTVQLSGVIQPGQTFVVGGPTSSNANGNPVFDQVINFTPDFQNVATAADGVALFNVLASAITPTTVPIDAIVYGTSNSSGLIDESGVANPPDVADVPRGESIERTNRTGSWSVQNAPTPNAATPAVTSPGTNAPVFNSDPIVKTNSNVDTVYQGSLAGDASDPDGDALSFLKLSGPDWLTLSMDGSLGGTPRQADLGANSFAVQVTDSTGLSATATLSITVELDSTLPPGSLLLSEVLYDGVGPDGSLEWVELYNTTDQAIDLSAFSLGNGGNDYTYSVVQLSGVIQPGQTFVVGGPTSSSANANPVFDLALNFTPDFQNVATAGDGVALFDVMASSITPSTVPIDAVVYGDNNSSGLIDESGFANAPEVVDVLRGDSIERVDLAGSWAAQLNPTPGVVSAGIQPPVVASLILSEVLYDAVGPDDGQEWVELFNTTTQPIDLSGFSLGNGGSNYTYSVAQLSGTIGAGQTFVVGGPSSSANNGNPSFDLVLNFTPDFQNVATSGDGVALFDVLATEITPTTVPIDAVIYGPNNNNGLIDESGVANTPDVDDPGRGISVERINLSGNWVVQAVPTAGTAAAGLVDPGSGEPAFSSDPIDKSDATVDSPYQASLANDASDPNGDALSFIKVSGPAWLLLNSDGDLSGTPGSADLGANSFVVQVVDETGLSDTATLNITVVDVAGPLLTGYSESIPMTALSYVPSDLSGNTYVVDTNTMYLIANKGNRIWEVDINFNLLRTITTVGFGDSEDIVYLGLNSSGDQEFAIVEERESELYIGTIPAGSTNITINKSNFQTVIFAPKGNNSGYEGVAFNPVTERFWVVKEKSAKKILSFIRPTGSADINIHNTVALTEPFNANSLSPADLSAVQFDSRTGNLLILSDDSHKIIEVDPNTGIELSELILASGHQHEGLTLDPTGNIFVTSEANKYGKYVQGP